MSAVQDNHYTVNIVGHLVVNGKSLAIGQICQDKLVLLESCDLPPTEAQLIVKVAGRTKIYDIVLPHGIDRDSEVATFF